MATPGDVHVFSDEAYLGSHTERTVTLSDGDALTVGELHVLGASTFLPLDTSSRPSAPSLSPPGTPVAGGGEVPVLLPE